MDTERLIRLVRDRPEIYDPLQPNYRSREVIAGMWRDIARELNANDNDVKLKWQHLRSNYMREKRKIKSIPSGLENTVKIWPFYEKLSFLDGSVRHRDTSSSPSLDICIEYPDEASGDDVENPLSFENTRLSSIVGSGSTVLKKRAKKRAREDPCQDAYYEDFNQFEEPVDETNHPDMLFLRSLLPTLKQLSPIQNLELKGEILQLLKNKLIANQSYHSFNSYAASPHSDAAFQSPPSPEFKPVISTNK